MSDHTRERKRDRLPRRSGAARLILLIGALWLLGKWWLPGAASWGLWYDALFVLLAAVGAEWQGRRASRPDRRALERYRSLYEYNVDSIFMLDLQGRISEFNPAGQKQDPRQYVTGYTAQELIHNHGARFPEEERVKCQAHFADAIAGREQVFETRAFHKDGHLVDMTVYLIPMREEGEIVGIYGIATDITERKNERRRLIESEQRYKSLFENNPDAVYSISLKGRFLSGNPACKKITGYTVAEWAKFSMRQMLPESSFERCYEHFQKAVQGIPQKFELPLVRKDGEPIELTVTLIPIVIDDKVTGVYGIAKDITERKRAEMELRGAKEQLESFISNSPDAIYMCDLDGFVHQVNRGFVRMFGYAADEVIGGKIRVIIPDELFNDELERIKEVWASNWEYNCIDTIRRHKDGRYLNISLTLSPVRNNEGIVIGMAGIARDMTARYEMEEALRQSETKYRLITENMSDLIGVSNREGVLEYASPSFKTLTGFGPEELIGKQAFKLLHPDDGRVMAKHILKVLRDKEPFQTQFRILCTDGQYLLIEGHGAPVLNDEGEVDAVVIVGRDITERERTEELLRKSDKLSVVGELAAGVAHEIRNPLTAIKGFIQLLQMGGDNKAHYYEIMMSELDRIEFIIHEFLVLAKPQAVRYQKKDMRALLHTIAALLDTQAILNNVVIRMDAEDDIPLIECEENRLKQVFINVMKNAIEAMPSGGELLIEVQKAPEGMVLLRFTDTGCGIPESRIPKLGEPFYTTKEKGTGLGLMVSYKIIEEHAGTIAVSSVIDEGTVVEILLPAVMRERA
ncbi:two-component system sporulation sensor kinase A [Tumebacillus sp. BK434]|uniref:PAS domain-containing sensor histidine kinase n=1 Tax=Tumebacillus sp. BK434 TaxID=2512169 RepID=UPI0010441D4E|nr:PAS domain-containing sensor histidine kinase [Tumebacillus sp. BK434]TCP59115.1 two-component system sporulation sensor kinase A [Tumebacillus sp. BK434]